MQKRTLGCSRGFIAGIYLLGSLLVANVSFCNAVHAQTSGGQKTAIVDYLLQVRNITNSEEYKELQWR